MQDFGAPPEVYGHCKIYRRSGSRQGSDFACDQYEPAEGFAQLTRSADHDRNFTDANLIRKQKASEREPRKRASSGTSRVSKRVAAAEQAAADYNVNWRNLIGSRTIGDASKYRITEEYKVGDLIDHPKYDLGVVVDVIDSKKAKVAFRVGEKVLVMRYGQ